MYASAGAGPSRRAARRAEAEVLRGYPSRPQLDEAGAGARGQRGDRRG